MPRHVSGIWMPISPSALGLLKMRKRQKERQRGRGTTSPESASMSRWVGKWVGEFSLLENGSSFLLHPMMKPGMLCGEPLWGPSTADEVRNPRNHSSYGVNMLAMDIMDATMINYRGKMCFILLFPPFLGAEDKHTEVFLLPLVQSQTLAQ